MKLVIGLALVMFVAGAGLAYALKPAGVPTAALTLMLAERDARVARVLSERDLEREITGVLRDSIKDLGDVSAEVVARVEVRHDTIRVTDTLHIELEPDVQAEDTIEVTLPEFEDQGITVTEVIKVSPPPRFFSRSVSVAFDPDTIALALVRDEFGIARILAASEREGVDVRTIFAGEVSSEPGLLSRVFDWSKPVSCLATGWAMARDHTTVLLGTGIVCLAGFVIKH